MQGFSDIGPPPANSSGGGGESFPRGRLGLGCEVSPRTLQCTPFGFSKAGFSVSPTHPVDPPCPGVGVHDRRANALPSRCPYFLLLSPLGLFLVGGKALGSSGDIESGDPCLACLVSVMSEFCITAAETAARIARS
jgi:hypothetical protein